MALTYLELAEKVLDETHTVLSPTEIWKIAENNQWSTQLEQRSKRPAGTLYGAMFTDSRDNPNSIFVRIGTRPIRYGRKTDPQPSGLRREKRIKDAVHVLLFYSAPGIFDGYQNVSRLTHP